MNKYLISFVLICSNLCVPTYSEEYGTPDGLSSLLFDVTEFSDSVITVHQNAIINRDYSGDINIINASTCLYNHGKIYGRIDTNGNKLVVINTGDISEITTENGGNVEQKITKPDELKEINVDGGNFIVSIENYENLDFDDIKNMPADSFSISNSSIVVNNLSDWQNIDKTIKLIGATKLYINDVDNITDGMILNNVSSSDNLNIKNTDELHKVQLNSVNDSVILNIVRETNYEKIFDDVRGTLLKTLRLQGKDNRLLSKMDAAETMDELESIMGTSYHFNSSLLLHPIKTINLASVMSGLFDKDQGLGAGINFDYIISDKISNLGAHLSFGDKYNDLYLKLKFNVNKFSYKDKINDFDGFVYGVDFNARQYIANVWLDGLFGFNRTYFDADNIYLNDEIKNDPKGKSEYLRLNLGYDYTQITDFVISALVGFNYQNVSVFDVSDKDTDFYAGSKLKYEFVTDGVKYEYGAFLTLNQSGNLFCGIDIGFWSVEDELGITVGADAFQDDFDMNYQLSAKAKLLF